MVYITCCIKSKFKYFELEKEMKISVGKSQNQIDVKYKE
jgi:hypothetical protein